MQTLIEGNDVQRAAEAFQKAMTYEKSGSRKGAWQAPNGLPTVQAFALDISLYVSQYHMELEMFEKATRLLRPFWSKNGCHI